jgi:alginate production protein
MIHRKDKTGADGRPVHVGVRAYGMPSNRFNFWSELSLLRGKDETKKKFKGHAVDFGGTYRFPNVPLAPNVTLGYANGSGDDNPNDGLNHQFRQTGLQSNETRLGGIPKIKYYGETLDPELSNLQIVMLAVGIRPVPTMTLDLVYHHYRLNKIADEIRNMALTAQMNQDDVRLSKKVGQALDIVFGFRNLFGIRRLGLDVRTGIFFPGAAFRNENIGSDPTTFRKADKSISVLAKFWY